jgi:hypothetical protein
MNPLPENYQLTSEQRSELNKKKNDHIHIDVSRETKVRLITLAKSKDQPLSSFLVLRTLDYENMMSFISSFKSSQDLLPKMFEILNKIGNKIDKKL